MPKYPRITAVAPEQHIDPAHIAEVPWDNIVMRIAGSFEGKSVFLPAMVDNIPITWHLGTDEQDVTILYATKDKV